ncbi:MAG: patatin-like phospholipase family protein [Methylobacteriaceae bacterium]|nr:patatin-like phospholipase family protein [Methylobacteriaceae bacterium]
MTGQPGPAPALTGLMGPRFDKPISLALQGGGAHGAFTWGVLDKLLEDSRLGIEAISGASAGSVNAVLLVSGWIAGGADEARATLERFWRQISYDGDLSDAQRGIFDRLFTFWSPGGAASLWFEFLQQQVSPYQTNPLDINPLRDLLARTVDFERLRASEVKLFISATSVRTGKIKIFETHELMPEHVVASACLPTLFQAVEIDGEAYWDGGYSGNPALFPIFYAAHSDDVLLVQINPIERKEIPRDAQEIQNRLTEINFNAGLLRELRVIEFVTRLIDEGKLSRDQYKRVLMHRIGGDGALERFAASSRLKAEWDFFLQLRDIGRAAAETWLTTHYDAVGRQGTLDLRAAYG